MSKTSAVDFETILLRLLLEDADLAALVDKKVFALVIPQGTKLPCVSFQRISGEPANCLDGHSGLENITLQVDAWGRTYAETKQVAKAVRAAMPATSETFGARLTMDQDLHEAETRCFRVSMDFEIWFLENA